MSYQNEYIDMDEENEPNFNLHNNSNKLNIRDLNMNDINNNLEDLNNLNDKRDAIIENNITNNNNKKEKEKEKSKDKEKIINNLPIRTTEILISDSDLTDKPKKKEISMVAQMPFRVFWGLIEMIKQNKR